MATRGLSVTADAAGNLKAAATANGAPVFTAQAPTMWDSATTPHTAPLRVEVLHGDFTGATTSRT